MFLHVVYYQPHLFYPLAREYIFVRKKLEMAPISNLNRCRRYIVAAILLFAQQLRLSLVCYVKWSFKICLMQANRLSGLSII